MMRWSSVCSVAVCALVLTAVVAAPVLAENHVVLALPDNTFDPADLTIAVGDSVTWMNEGGLHNVNAPGFFRCANGCDGDGGDGSPATNDWSFTLTFDDPGFISYFCDVHIPQGMFGSLTIEDGGGGMDLQIVGSCPGDIQLNLTGATPNGGVAFALANAEGSANVPVGNCAGTPLDLDSPSLLTVLSADGNGEISLMRNVQGASCGKWLQAVDTTSCATSDTAQIPN